MKSFIDFNSLSWVVDAVNEFLFAGWNSLFTTWARSDLQVCAHGSAAGNVSIVTKQFTKLGVKTWSELADAQEFPGKHVGACF